MKSKRHLKEKAWYLLAGALLMLSLVILTGAGTGENLNGRYQATAWGTNFGENAGGCGAFVLDTVTGNVTTAYTVIYGVPPRRTVLVNNLRKPFDAIK